MNTEQLNKIESHIGYYRSESIKREESPRFETFDPNAEIQELVNEVRRLKTQTITIKKGWPEFIESFVYGMGLLEAQKEIADKFEIERDKAIKELQETNELLHDASVTNSSISFDRNSKKIIIKDLEERVEQLEKDKAILSHICQKNKIIIPRDGSDSDIEKELEAAQTARATAETERDQSRKNLCKEMDKCHEFAQAKIRTNAEEFSDGGNVVDAIIMYTKKLERMVEKACKDGRYLEQATGGWMIAYHLITRKWLERKSE